MTTLVCNELFSFIVLRQYDGCYCSQVRVPLKSIFLTTNAFSRREHVVNMQDKQEKRPIVVILFIQIYWNRYRNETKYKSHEANAYVNEHLCTNRYDCRWI